jgi:hypothetical protein
MSAIMAKMVRTTIMADPDLLDELRAIAKEERPSLGEVIRQGLVWRARTKRRVPSFIGAVASPEPTDPRDEEEILLEYARAKDASRRDPRL